VGEGVEQGSGGRKGDSELKKVANEGPVKRKSKKKIKRNINKFFF